MAVEISCSTCGHHWIPNELPDSCERCGAAIVLATAISAASAVPSVSPSAIQEGPPTSQEDIDDARWRRRMTLRSPRAEVWLAVVCGVVGLSAGVDALQAMTEAEKARAIWALINGEGGVAPILQRHQISNFLSIVGLVLFLATACAGVGWLRAVYENLLYLRVAGLSATPGQLLIQCISPWSWLRQPYRALQEAWRASDPKSRPNSDGWRERSGSWLILLWWAMFLAHCVRINITIMPFPADNKGLLIVLLVAALVTAIACCAGVIASALLCVITLRLERRQWQRYERLRDW